MLLLCATGVLIRILPSPFIREHLFKSSVEIKRHPFRRRKTRLFSLSSHLFQLFTLFFCFSLFFLSFLSFFFVSWTTHWEWNKVCERTPLNVCDCKYRSAICFPTTGPNWLFSYLLLFFFFCFCFVWLAWPLALLCVSLSLSLSPTRRLLSVCGWDPLAGAWRLSVAPIGSHYCSLHMQEPAGLCIILTWGLDTLSLESPHFSAGCSLPAVEKKKKGPSLFQTSFHQSEVILCESHPKFEENKTQPGPRGSGKTER